MVVDRLWVADITYVPLAHRFVYLTVVLDAYSRKGVGRGLDDDIEGQLAEPPRGVLDIGAG